MLTRLRIQNFKAWKDTGNIDLAPLTVFFGPNSSGKTSLLQFLLLLKQTVESRDRKQVLNFAGSHSIIDFGVWPEMLFGGNAKNGLCFELSWPISPLAPSRKERIFFPGARMTFKAEIGSTSAAVGVRGFSYTMNHPGWNPPIHVGMQYADEAGSYRLSIGQHSEALSSSSAQPARFYGFPDEAREYLGPPGIWRHLDDFEFLLEEQLDTVRHLGPIREQSERRHMWSGEAPSDVGLGGEETISALLAAQGRWLQRANANASETICFEELLAAWLVRMGILESFEARQSESDSSLYRVMVRTPGSNRSVDLVDVGFGVSQVLPVLVQLLYAEPHTTLMFEQPEVHLHPRAQSELADLFIETLGMKQDGEARGIQCLVESHSEHFLRRLQRRIAEGLLTPEQTALYFCKPGPEGSIIEKLQIDTYGRISNWPENFFGDALGDTEEQMDAMLRRMEQEEPNAAG